MLEHRWQPVLDPAAWAWALANQLQVDDTTLTASVGRCFPVADGIEARQRLEAGLAHFTRKKTIILTVG